MTDDKKPDTRAVPTRELPAADRTEIQLAELKVLLMTGLGQLDTKVAIGFRDVESKVDGIETKVDRMEGSMELQKGEIGIVKQELGVLFSWKGDVEKRFNNNSQRAQASSQVDLEHEGKISANITRTEKLENAVHETRALAEAAAKTLQEQSDYMGVGVRGIKWLVSKEGRNSVMRLATLAGVVYATLKASGIIK